MEWFIISFRGESVNPATIDTVLRIRNGMCLYQLQDKKLPQQMQGVKCPINSYKFLYLEGCPINSYIFLYLEGCPINSYI